MSNNLTRCTISCPLYVTHGDNNKFEEICGIWIVVLESETFIKYITIASNHVSFISSLDIMHTVDINAVSNVWLSCREVERERSLPLEQNCEICFIHSKIGDRFKYTCKIDHNFYMLMSSSILVHDVCL